MCNKIVFKSLVIGLLIFISNPINSFSGDVARGKRIYLTGKVIYKLGKEPVEGATVGIKGTKIYCIADKSGSYNLDVTEIVDSCKSIIVLATYTECRLMEIDLNYKIKKSTVLNIELSKGARHDSEKIILNKKGKKR